MPKFWSLVACALVTTLPRSALAHDVVPPKARSTPAAVWPGGKSETHDVIVPLVITIGADGTVEDAAVEASVTPSLDAAAIACARSWTYEPALRDGKPVSAHIRAMVRFVGIAPAAPPVAPPPEKAAPPAKPEPPMATVQVTGQAAPRSASEVTRGRDVLGAAPHRTASDLLSVVPGVFVTQHSGEGKAHQIFLRGFDAVHGQDVEIWVAGAPVNEVSNVHGQGYADLHFVMPEIVKEIHATPGSYDPRQGDFAVAGTLRFRLGYDEAGVTTKATYGSFGTRRLFLAYHPKDAPDATFAAFETYATDGFGPSRAANRTSAVAQVTHDFDGGLALRVMGSAYAGRFDSAGVRRRSDIERGGDPFATYDPKQGGSSSRVQIVAELHKDSVDDRWSFAPYAIVRSLALRSNFTGYLEDPAQGDNTQQLNDALTVGATAFYKKRLPVFSKTDALEAGLVLRHDRVTQSQTRIADVGDTPTAQLVSARVRGTDVGGYLDASFHVLPRVRVRAGVRADGLAYTAQDGGQLRASQGAHFGKKATVDVSVVPDLHALVSYGEGFRSPQARSLVEGQTTPFTEVRSFEAGLRYAHRERLAGSLAAFYTRLSDDLVFDQVTARNEAVPGTARAGLAMEMVARPTKSFVSSVSATYTRASFVASRRDYAEGALLPYVPQLVARADVAYKPALGTLFGRPLEGHFGAGFTSLHRRPLPYGEIGRDIFLVDATAQLHLREVDVGVDVYNLLDDRWFDGEFVYASRFERGGQASLVPERHVTVGAPRTLMASVTLHL